LHLLVVPESALWTVCEAIVVEVTLTSISIVYLYFGFEDEGVCFQDEVEILTQTWTSVSVVGLPDEEEAENEVRGMMMEKEKQKEDFEKQAGDKNFEERGVQKKVWGMGLAKEREMHSEAGAGIVEEVLLKKEDVHRKHNSLDLGYRGKVVEGLVEGLDEAVDRMFVNNTED
jgi:hypothetical protein